MIEKSPPEYGLVFTIKPKAICRHVCNRLLNVLG